MFKTQADIERIEKLPIFFIVSRGRSGSTLLRTLLDAHPNIVIPLESRCIEYLYYQYNAVSYWTPLLIQRFICDLIALPDSKELNFDRNKLENDLLQVIQQSATITYASLFKIVYLNFQSIYQKKSIAIIGDKNTRNFFFLEHLLELFPNAKFIHIIRDYRANIMSYLKMNMEPKIISSLAYRWKYYNRKIYQFQQKHNNLVYTIRYEDLVTDTTFYLKEICQFLCIDYSSSMLEYHNKVSEYKTVNPQKMNIYYDSIFSQPITNNKVHSWKTEMKQYDIRIADGIAGKFAEKYGYYKKSEKKHYFLLFLLLPCIFYGWFYCFLKKICNKSPLLMRIFYSFYRKFSFLFD